MLASALKALHFMLLYMEALEESLQSFRRGC
jgi:hypothetical protein